MWTWAQELCRGALQILFPGVCAACGRTVPPEQQPFYGGTYWPPRSRMGMPGFTDVLRGVLDAWQNRRDEVQRAALDLTDGLVSQALLVVVEDLGDFRVQAVLLERGTQTTVAADFAALTAGIAALRLEL